MLLLLFSVPACVLALFFDLCFLCCLSYLLLFAAFLFVVRCLSLLLFMFHSCCGHSWASWCFLGPSGGLLGRFLPFLGALGPLLGALGALLGRSWALLGGSWEALGRSWPLLGRSWDDMQKSSKNRCHFGAILAPFGHPFWSPNRSFWGSIFG